VPVDESDSSLVSLTFLIGIQEFARRWKIKITQLPCSMPQELLAPQGCLQYFNTPKGFIKTFNFEGKKHLQNIDYSICIRKPKNMCYLTLNAVKYVPPPPTTTTTTTTLAPSSELFTTSSVTPRPFSSSSTTEEVNVPEPVFNGNNINNINNINASTRINVASARYSERIRYTRFAEDEFCSNDGYWITWPGSNRICSSHIEQLNDSIQITGNSPEIIHFHSLTWTQSMSLKSNMFNSLGFGFNYNHAPCTHGFI